MLNKDNGYHRCFKIQYRCLPKGRCCYCRPPKNLLSNKYTATWKRSYYFQGPNTQEMSRKISHTSALRQISKTIANATRSSPNGVYMPLNLIGRYSSSSLAIVFDYLFYKTGFVSQCTELLARRVTYLFGL